MQGKGNSKDFNHPNIVPLTLREHYLAHYLLTKIYPENESLKFAFMMMNSLHKELNSALYIYGRKLAVEALRNRKISKERKERISKTEEGKITPQSKQVLCLTDNRIFPSISLAASYYNLNKSNLSKVVNKQHKSVKGLQFCFLEEKEEYLIFLNEERKARISERVICINTGIIYDSANQAAREMNLSSGSIRRVCKGLRKSHKDFFFSYFEEGKEYFMPERAKNGLKKKVVNIDTGEIFNSLEEASKKYNLRRGSLSNHLNGNQYRAAGCYWRYA
jgi:hypothetical protein